MGFVQNPKIIPKVIKPTMKERWIKLNKSITSFLKINKFIYYCNDKPVLIAKTVRSLEGYEEAKQNIINTTLTGLLIGFAIYSWKTGNSFLQGISIAITLVMIETYAIWFKKQFMETKKKNGN